MKSTASGGDLLRDHNGNWIKGFLVKIDRCSAVEAELWAVLHGLKNGLGQWPQEDMPEISQK